MFGMQQTPEPVCPCGGCGTTCPYLDTLHRMAKEIDDMRGVLDWR